MTLPGEPHPLDYPGPAAPQERRTFLKRLLVALGYTGAGSVLGAGGSQLLAPPPAVSPSAGNVFDWFRDAPVGVVTYYEGDLAAHPNLPSGSSPKWTVISDDRVLVGTTSAVALGTEGGAESLTAEGAHAGASIANHATDGAHTHDPHTTLLTIGALVGTVLNGPGTHASQGGHVHDPHVFTEPATHAVKRWHKSYVLKKVLA